MTQPVKKVTNVQLNLNTLLLTICMGLSGWVLWSINQLDSEISGIMPLINVNSKSIEDINRVDKDQSKELEDVLNRLTKLETMLMDRSRSGK